jgi:26S proteasome regulatory subunit N12
MPPSENEFVIVALNLMRLLVQNRIAEFHTELELLPADVGCSFMVLF